MRRSALGLIVTLPRLALGAAADSGAGSARWRGAVRIMEPRIDQTQFGSVTIEERSSPMT